MSDYDVAYIIPKYAPSPVKSRADVDLRSDFHGLFPLISSPMRGISGPRLVIEMANNNCLGILHRFANLDTRIQNIKTVAEQTDNFGVAIGVLNEDELHVARWAVECGAKLICLDIANGYLPQVQETAKTLRPVIGHKISLMTGNVLTADGVRYIKNSGFDFVRCSVGSGSLCITRLATGIGRNALEVLQDCSNIETNKVIDGGIRYPGDVVKSFACGADFAMLGSALANTEEAENEGRIFGMASAINHVENGKEIKSIEGRELNLDMRERRPLKSVIDEFIWGIRSACTYLGCHTYKLISNRCELISSSGVGLWK